MFTWARIPFVRITIFFVLGIVTGLVWPDYQKYIAILFLVNFIFLIALKLFMSRLLVNKNQLYGLSISVLFILLGYLVVWSHNDFFNRRNLVHQEAVEAYLGEVRSAPERKTKSYKILVEVEAVKTPMGWLESRGNLLVYLEPKDNLPEFGDRLLIQGSPEMLDPPRNPYQFNYQKYLANKQIFHSHWVSHNNWQIIDEASGFDIFRLANQSRDYLEGLLKASISDERVFGVIKALVLGNKEDLDPQTKEVFARAGAMHVLAVSGLHVGIVYLILVQLFKPFTRKIRFRWIVSVVIILLLWFYAFITGLSPSVMRAVTMFTIIELGRRLGRESSVFNSLALSAFLLLWFNPYLVTQVGFQLSYIAVTGILLLYQPIFNLLSPVNPVARFVWQIIAVSCAAQLATAPLAAFYFNQLPTYFLLTNLIVIPAATLVIWGGVILLVAGAMLPPAANVLGRAIEFIVQMVELLLGRLTDLPFATLSRIAFDWPLLLLIYAFIALLILYIKIGFRRSIVYGMFTVTLLVAGLRIYRVIEQNKRVEIVFYGIGGGSWAIDLVQNGQFVSLSDSLLTEASINYELEPYRLHSGLVRSAQSLNSEKVSGLGEIFVWQGRSILIAESCVHHLQHLQEFDFILQPRHPRYLECYSDQNLLLKLVNEDSLRGHDLRIHAYVAPL